MGSGTGRCCRQVLSRLQIALAKRQTRPPAEFAPPSLAPSLAGSIARLDRVLNEYPTKEIPAAERSFYDFHLYTQAAMLRQFIQPNRGVDCRKT